MSNKYFEAISQIKADDKLNEEIVKRLEQEKNKKYKGGIIIKLRKIITGIISTIGVLLCSSVAYAALGGTIDGMPVLDWIKSLNDVKFSENYVEYVEVVENKKIEKNGNVIELVSTLCDDGWVLLDFKVALKEKKDFTGGVFFNNEIIKSDEGIKILDVYTTNNIIINNNEFYLRGRTRQEIFENEDGTYEVYQLYFITKEEISEDNTYKITLNNAALQLDYDNDEVIDMEGKFEIEVSKEKAVSNEQVIENVNQEVIFKTMKQKIDKVTVTPLQNIIELSTEFTNLNLEKLTEADNKDYVGLIRYYAYDQDGNEIALENFEVERVMTYEDGEEERWLVGEIETNEEFKNATLFLKEYLCIEKNDDIKEITIVLYEENSYLETFYEIGSYTINLDK